MMKTILDVYQYFLDHPLSQINVRYHDDEYILVQTRDGYALWTGDGKHLIATMPTLMMVVGLLNSVEGRRISGIHKIHDTRSTENKEELAENSDDKGQTDNHSECGVQKV